MKVLSCIRGAAVVVGALLAWSVLEAQQATPPVVAKLVAEPARVTMRAGQTVPVKVTAYDAQGKEIPGAQVFVFGPRLAVTYSDGKLKALRAGSFNATAVAAGAPGAQPIQLQIPVIVSWPPLAKLEVIPEPGQLFTGVMLAHTVKGSHEDGSDRPGLPVTWRSSDPSVATVDRFGNVSALKAGSVTISAEAEDTKAQRQYTITANPVTAIDIDLRENMLNTGDVMQLKATAKRANGTPVENAKITWTYVYTPDDTTKAPGGPAIIDASADGKPVFAANHPGQFTIQAQSGNVLARTVVDVKPRDVRRRITITGRGSVSTTHTSDLWPWTGKEGGITASSGRGAVMATPSSSTSPT